MGWRAGLITILWLLAGVVSAPPAAAAGTTCSFSDGVVNLSTSAGAQADGGLVYLKVAAESSVLKFTLGPSNEGRRLIDCGGATVDDTTAVNVTMTSTGPVAADVSLGTERFSPEGETSGVAFTFDVTASTDPWLRIVGGPLADRIRAGTGGVDYDDDGEVDVTIVNDDARSLFLKLEGGGEGDELWASGGGATGAPVPTGAFLSGESGDDTLHGSDSGDGLWGGSGDDDLSGRGGRDTLRGGDVWGGGGDDRLSGDAGSDHLLGGAGDDELLGRGGNDHLHGENGADALLGGEGADALSGGNDRDTVSYSSAASGVVVTPNGRGDDGAVSGGVTEGDNVLDDVEVFIGSAFDDRLTGADFWAGRDHLLGGRGDDVLTGLDGRDMLDGGRGADTLHGGDGGDTVRAGAGDDTVSGGEGPDRLVGGYGADALRGGGGNDGLRGQGGTDALDGGADCDLCRGGRGSDTVTACEAAPPAAGTGSAA